MFKQVVLVGLALFHLQLQRRDIDYFIMSSVGVADEVCACCGKAAVDNIKLKNCACNLVKYCGVVCQKKHRSQHKKACKKRMAELRDDKLFTQPDESYLGECPLCCLPQPLDRKKSTIHTCCSQRICLGCGRADYLRQMRGGLEHKCPFCREPIVKSAEEMNKNEMERVKADDPVALCLMSKKCRDEGDYEGAFVYSKKAAELGEAAAHYDLSHFYAEGLGVETDMKKVIYHLEEAAIGGHDLARYNLGAYDWNAGRYDRAVKHYIIAANLGDDIALERVEEGFQRGLVSKDDYAAALRGHQAAVDATKSQQREEAYAASPGLLGN
jgi:hypothetical protein